MIAGLKNSTRPLVFTSVSGCRASEYFDISSENKIFPMDANKFCDAGQVPIFRYFEAWIVVIFNMIPVFPNMIPVSLSHTEHTADMVGHPCKSYIQLNQPWPYPSYTRAIRVYP